MADNKKVIRKDEKQLVVHEINRVNVDRTPKEVADWRNAHRTAESVHYPNRSRLLDLYQDVWLDGHLTGIWGKRQSAATNKEIKFLNKNGEEVEELNTLFESQEWEKLINLIVDSKLWGLSGVEFIPGQKFRFNTLPRKHILIEKKQIKINQNDIKGIDYSDNPFVMVFGDEEDLGLMLKCSYYALIKKGNFSDWAQYSEIFGQPIRVAYYDAYDDKTRMQLKEVLDDSGSSLALMIPKQAEFSIMDGKTSNGNGELQEKLKNACNAEMSIIILGNTETTSNENGGSQAKAEVHKEGEEDLNKKDIKLLLSYLNSDKFINILDTYGYPVSGGKFTIQQESDPKKIKESVEIISKVRDAGTPVDDDYIYEITGIPKPDNYDELKKEMKERNAFNFHANYLDQDKTHFKKTTNNKDEDSDEDDVEDLKDSVWNKLRLKLADFFVQAP